MIYLKGASGSCIAHEEGKYQEYKDLKTKNVCHILWFISLLVTKFCNFQGSKEKKMSNKFLIKPERRNSWAGGRVWIKNKINGTNRKD